MCVHQILCMQINKCKKPKTVHGFLFIKSVPCFYDKPEHMDLIVTNRILMVAD